MNAAQMQARAIQRAHDLRLHVMQVPGRPGVYTVRSASEPDTRHTVVDHEGTQACDCRGFYYRQSCAHVEALRNRLAREAVQRRQPAQLRPETAPALSRLYPDAA